MSKDKIDFSTGLKELEAIASWFESHDIDLDAGLKKFERGMELSVGLKKHLELMESQVQKVKAKFDGDTESDSAPTPNGPASETVDPSLFN